MEERNSNKQKSSNQTKFDTFVLRLKNIKWIALVLILFVIIVGIGSFTDALSKIISLFKPQPPASATNSSTINVGGNNSGQIAGGNIYNSTVMTQSQTEQTAQEWQPPSLPEGCKMVTVTTAGGTIQNPVSWSRWSVIGSTLQEGGVVIFPESQIHMYARVISNRFCVDANITLNAIDDYAVSNMIFVGTMPPSWDRNSNSNAFEIVDSGGLPVFQEIYLLPEHIVVNGIFPKKPGIIVGMFGTHMVSGFPDEVLTNLPDRKPLFKYPSWKYRGVLTD